MFSLTFVESVTVICLVMLLAYAVKVVSYAAGDQINSVNTRVLSLVCQWQTKRMFSKRRTNLDPITDPKWVHFYVPTYKRLGRSLSIES